MTDLQKAIEAGRKHRSDRCTVQSLADGRKYDAGSTKLLMRLLEALDAQPAQAVPDAEESAYVIDKLAKLLAEIAIIVNGVEPPLTAWSYHDLPEKVRALKAQPAQAVPDEKPYCVDEDARDEAYRLGWNNCRAAMLAAQEVKP